MDKKPEYVVPTVEEVGSFEEITKASSTGPLSDTPFGQPIQGGGRFS